LVHPKDKVKDGEKTELIYRIPCKNCPSSYIGETGRTLGLRMKEHRKEVDSGLLYSWNTHPTPEPPEQGRVV